MPGGHFWLKMPILVPASIPKTLRSRKGHRLLSTIAAGFYQRDGVVGAIAESGKGWRTMTEAAGGGRGEVERRLTERSLQDEAFRQRLLEDPPAEERIAYPLWESPLWDGWIKEAGLAPAPGSTEALRRSALMKSSIRGSSTVSSFSW